MYNFRKANFPLLYELLLTENWSILERCDNVDDARQLFYNKLYMIFDLTVSK